MQQRLSSEGCLGQYDGSSRPTPFEACAAAFKSRIGQSRWLLRRCFVATLPQLIRSGNIGRPKRALLPHCGHLPTLGLLRWLAFATAATLFFRKTPAGSAHIAIHRQRCTADGPSWTNLLKQSGTFAKQGHDRTGE